MATWRIYAAAGAAALLAAATSVGEPQQVMLASAPLSFERDGTAVAPQMTLLATAEPAEPTEPLEAREPARPRTTEFAGDSLSHPDSIALFLAEVQRYPVMDADLGARPRLVARVLDYERGRWSFHAGLARVIDEPEPRFGLAARLTFRY